MHITLLCPSSIMKEPSIRTIADEYIKRINGTTSIIETSCKIKQNDNEETIKSKQAESLIAAIDKLSKNTVIIALDERGKDLDSRHFAKTLSDFQVQGYSDICIIIGGAFGLEKSILEKTHLQLSLGKMVWPHRFVAIMILEQLYRAQQINSGHPYHKD